MVICLSALRHQTPAFRHPASIFVYSESLSLLVTGHKKAVDTRFSHSDVHRLCVALIYTTTRAANVSLEPNAIELARFASA